MDDATLEHLSSALYPPDRVEAALADPSASVRLFSAVRAEGEERFRAAVTAFLSAQKHPRQPTLGGLARDRFEGLVGVLDERACDHLAKVDLARLAQVIPSCAPTDLVDLVLAVELGDEDAGERLGARLAEVPPTELPDELHSDVVGAKRLYQALRARFSDPGEELEFLAARNGPRLICAGAAVLADELGQPWPELIPTHNRGSTNASRALLWVAAALGDEALRRWLDPILRHPRAKGRIACAGLRWDARFDGVGGGQAVRVRRYRGAVLSEVGKSHPKIAALPNRPRRSVEVYEQLERAKAEFTKRIEALTAKHGLEPVDPAALGPALERTCGSLPSDFGIALLGLGAPCPELFWFRGDPEETRRAIARGLDPSTATAPNGDELLAQLGPYYWDVQRAELLVAAGARLRAPARLTEAARRGELHMARLLLQAGAPVEAAALEHASRWPRLHRLLCG